MNMQIPAIKPLHLSREWNRLLTSGGRGRKQGKPLSRKTVRNIAGLVSSAYTRGLRWGIAEENPVPASEPPVPKKKEGIALSVDQQERLIAGATAPWGMDVFLELDAATGARRGELLGLQWSDRRYDPEQEEEFERYAASDEGKRELAELDRRIREAEANRTDDDLPF
jgi:integrase